VCGINATKKEKKINSLEPSWKNSSLGDDPTAASFGMGAREIGQR
jgi:hypothetical protein